MYNGSSAPYVDVQFAKSGTWTSVTRADIETLSIRRGRQRADYRFDAGSLTVTLDNVSGIYDPDITTGTWTVGGVSILRAGLQVRVIATWAGVPYILFAGFMESNTVDQGMTPVATIVATDGLAALGKVLAPALSVTYGPYISGETTATRVARLLDTAGWPAPDRSIAAGGAQMSTDAQGRPMIDMLNECALAEGGNFWVSRDGKAVFETRSNKFTKPTMLEFSDVRPQPANTLEYDSLELQPGTLQLVNQAVINKTDPLYPANNKQYTATYTSSASSYGTSTMQADIPLFSTATAKALSWFYARKDSSPDTRVTSIGFDGVALGGLYPDFLTADLLDQIIVNRTTVDGRTKVWYLVIEGIDHDLTADGWSVRYYTSPMNPYTF